MIKEIKELSEVQKKAIDHIRQSFSKNINPVCALDMGLGKTFVACKIIQYILEEEPSSKILIIHKASQYDDPWCEELHGIKIISLEADEKNKNDIIDPKYHIYIHGKDRTEKYFHNGKYRFPQNVNVILTSYDTARRDLENSYYELSDMFDLIIFDEVHTVINYKITLAGRQLISLRSKHKLGITGTPFNNHTYDLSLLYFFLNDLNKIA
jgi:superfamily II DNA or RNA helicase